MSIYHERVISRDICFCMHTNWDIRVFLISSGSGNENFISKGWFTA